MIVLLWVWAAVQLAMVTSRSTERNGTFLNPQMLERVLFIDMGRDTGLRPFSINRALDTVGVGLVKLTLS
jgi:hypothetical protein